MSSRNHLVFAMLGMVAGCTLLTPVEGLVGDRDAAVDEGGALLESGADGDSPPDAAIEDSAQGAADGGGPDAVIACAQRPGSLFCDDFDDVANALDAKWSQSFTQNGGAIAAAPAPRSPPRAMRASAPSIDAGYAQANLQKILAPPAALPSAIAARFALSAESLGTAATGYNSFFSLTFADAVCATRAGGSKERRLALVFSDKGIHMAVIGFAADCVDAGEDFRTVAVRSGPLPLGTWHRIELVAARAPCPNGTDSSARVRIDDVEVLCTRLVIDPTSKLGSLSIRLGSNIGAEWAPSIVDFDDVEVVAEP